MTRNRMLGWLVAVAASGLADGGLSGRTMLIVR